MNIRLKFYSGSVRTICCQNVKRRIHLLVLWWMCCYARRTTVWRTCITHRLIECPSVTRMMSGAYRSSTKYQRRLEQSSLDSGNKHWTSSLQVCSGPSISQSCITLYLTIYKCCLSHVAVTESGYCCLRTYIKILSILERTLLNVLYTICSMTSVSALIFNYI